MKVSIKLPVIEPKNESWASEHELDPDLKDAFGRPMRPAFFHDRPASPLPRCGSMHTNDCCFKKAEIARSPTRLQSRRFAMTRERSVRMYANHLGLMVRGSDGVFKLVERNGKKREIGTYRSVDTLERGIERYGERMYLALTRKRRS